MDEKNLTQFGIYLSKSLKYRNSSKHDYQFAHIALHFCQKCNELV